MKQERALLGQSKGAEQQQQPQRSSHMFIIIKRVSDGRLILTEAGGRAQVALVAAFGPGVVKAGVKAGGVIGPCAKVCGGGGGGKPNFAQAGGSDASKIPEALELARTQLRDGLK
eukprot:266749-Prorocentrum_minimum.AAC.1